MALLLNANSEIPKMYKFCTRKLCQRLWNYSVTQKRRSYTHCMPSKGQARLTTTRGAVADDRWPDDQTRIVSHRLVLQPSPVTTTPLPPLTTFYWQVWILRTTQHFLPPTDSFPAPGSDRDSHLKETSAFDHLINGNLGFFVACLNEASRAIRGSPGARRRNQLGWRVNTTRPLRNTMSTSQDNTIVNFIFDNCGDWRWTNYGNL